jgi:hypothetical protein
MPTHSPRALFNAVLCQSAMAAVLCCIASQAHAQAVLPTGYVTSARLQAVASDQPFMAVVINNKGEVGGWTSKPAGTSTRFGYVPPAPWAPLQIGSFAFTTTKYKDVSPVVWTNGIPKVLPRYGGNTSTWLLDKVDDNTWLVGIAPKSGRVDIRDFDDALFWSSGNLSLPFGGGERTLKAGTYSALAVKQASSRVLVNNQGTLAGGVGASGNFNVVRNGQATDLLIPPETGFTRWDLVALSDTNALLIQGVVNDDRDALRCVLWKDGLLTAITPTPAYGVTCGAVSSNGSVVAGQTFQRTSTGGFLSMAIYTWRDGKALALSEAFPQGSFVANRMLVSNGGLLIFNQFDNGYQAKLALNGRIVGLKSLLAAGTIASDEDVEALSLNERGQLLVRVWAAGVPTTRHLVLTPI